MRLINLKLRNFKGVRDFELDAQGDDVNVFGDNATGKTTLADAFMWLLFDKDSQNRKDFEIKTLDNNGKPIHGLEHEVEATLDLNGRQITLKKVFSEKWTKKRGSAKAEFTGHTTDHYIDGVPVKKTEYQNAVANIAEENIFRLLTDPTYFNEHLHWQKRRELLLQVCGDVTDAEVIASSDKLALLPEILGNRTLEEHRKVIAARRREINQELERIPVRIDEATRALPDTDGDPVTIQKEIDHLHEKRRALEAELIRIDNGAEVVEKKKRVREVEIELLNLQQSLRAQTDKAIDEERRRLSQVTDQIDSVHREIRRLQAENMEAGRQIEVLQARLQSLRQEWQAINDRKFTADVNDTCPTCRQALPADQVQEARERALAEFNARKSADLEANVTEGKRLKAQCNAMMEQQQSRNDEIQKLQEELSRLQPEAAAIQERIEQLRQAVPDVKQHPEYQRLQAEMERLQSEINALRDSSAGAKAAVNQEIASLDDRINELRCELARIEQRKHGLARIEELKEQERALASEFERLEEELYLTEEFIRTKVRLLEERINNRFQFARFKLFNVLVNGGIEECCETTYNGVPYSNLNNGARLNVGLDIINVLADHYGFAPPVWIDNAESVTNILPTKGQQIRLVVSATDKQLRVKQHQEESIREAV